MHDLTQSLSIALLCPAAGGSAVYRARAMLALVNDSLLYDDLNACLQVGIYKEMFKPAFDVNFDLIPNPADRLVEVKLKKKTEGICKIKITDALGSIVKTTEFSCDNISHIIRTDELKPGVYIVKVNFNNSYEDYRKLIIVR